MESESKIGRAETKEPKVLEGEAIEELNEENVRAYFDLVMHGGTRGPVNGTAKIIYGVFKGRVNEGVPVAEMQAGFGHAKEPDEAAMKAVNRTNANFEKIDLNMAIEVRRRNREVKLHLVRRN